MSSVAFDFGGRTYVSGMYWTIAEPGKARESLEEFSSNFGTKAGLSIAVGDDGKSMLGFVEGSDTSTFFGSYSLAAELWKSIKSKNWSGVFQIGQNLFVYISVKDGLIQVNSDVVSDDLSFLMEFVLDDIDKWNPVHIFCPDYSIKKSNNLDVFKQVSSLKEHTFIIKNMSNDWLFKLLTFLILIFGLIMFYHYYNGVQTEKYNESVQSQERERAETMDLLKAISGNKR